MAKWIYTINSGTELREAIDADDFEATICCLSQCYQELLDKLSVEDKEWKQYNIEDTIDHLNNAEDMDEDEINWYLSEFYDLCDELKAFVAIA
jgi:predicted nucleotidyltransferase